MKTQEIKQQHLIQSVEHKIKVIVENPTYQYLPIDFDKLKAEFMQMKTEVKELQTFTNRHERAFSKCYQLFGSHDRKIRDLFSMIKKH